MRHLFGWLSVAGACLAVACGTDVQGLGPGAGRDSGVTADGAGVSSNGAGGDGGGATGSGSGSSGGGTSGTSSGSGGGGTPGNSSGTVATDSGSTGTVGMEGGASTSTGADASTTDAVAIFADGSGLCGNGITCHQGQQCDPTLGCVTCTTDMQCPASTRYCLVGNCVQCKSNVDCAGTSTPACSRNRCVQCATNADCSGATPYCAPTDSGSRCVQCLQSSQCPASAPRCNSGMCGKSGG
jgi:hypothetical protein